MDVSIRSLFGHLCSGGNFTHDNEMSLLKGEKATSMKRRRDESSPQDFPGSSTEEEMSSDEERGKDATRTTSTTSHKILNNRFVVLEPEARPRKRSRTSQEPVEISIQCPTLRISLPSGTRSPQCPCASQHYNGSPKGTTASNPKILPNERLSTHRIDDIRSSLEGWLGPRSPETEVHAQGNSGPTFQLMSETSVAASAPKREVEVNHKDPRISVGPSPRCGESKRNYYHCRWHMCNESFYQVSQLPWHVFHDHQPIDDSYQSSRETCLWRKCSGPTPPAFSAKELWMVHLEDCHHVDMSEMTRYSGKETEKPKFDSQESQDLSFRPSTDSSDDDETTGLDRPQGPAGTQADPISVSSQETSGTAIALPETQDPNGNGHESSSNNAAAHESQESHVSVSTSAFESQQSHQNKQSTMEDHHSNMENRPSKTQHRKEAYRAAKRTGGLGWAEMELVSSSGGHGEVEKEL